MDKCAESGQRLSESQNLSRLERFQRASGWLPSPLTPRLRAGSIYGLAPITLWAARKLVGAEHREMFRRVVRPLVASIVMAAGVLSMRLAIVDLALSWRLVALVVTGAALYSTTMWLIARPVVKEILDLSRTALTSGRSQVTVDD